MLNEIVIATDDERILQAAADFGAKAVMTSESHPTGTDRIAEAASSIPEAAYIINIQGDEPLIEPGLIINSQLPYTLMQVYRWRPQPTPSLMTP